MTNVQYIFLVCFPHLERKLHEAGILNVLFTSGSLAPNMEPVMNTQINKMWRMKEPPVLWGYWPNHSLSGGSQLHAFGKAAPSLWHARSSTAPCLRVKLSSSFISQFRHLLLEAFLDVQLHTTAVLTTGTTLGMPWGAGLVWWLGRQALQPDWLISNTGFSSY